MESLMKKDLVEVINRQRSGTLDEYIAEPNVITEDIEDKVFDIVDGKGTTATIKRNVGEGYNRQNQKYKFSKREV